MDSCLDFRYSYYEFDSTTGLIYVVAVFEKVTKP